ncbi:MAG: hypothetical protein SFY92_00085 [Verrucomicrobiae bacterium]|nr:hypothetical protein [Verrucomicrobiae bacterium]
MLRLILVALLSTLSAGLLACGLILTGAVEEVDHALIPFRAGFRPKTAPPPELVLIAAESNRLNLALLLDALIRKPPRTVLLLGRLDTRTRNQGEFETLMAEKLESIRPVVLVCGANTMSHDLGQGRWQVLPPILPNYFGNDTQIPYGVSSWRPLGIFADRAAMVLPLPTNLPRASSGYPMLMRVKPYLLPTLPLGIFLAYDNTLPLLMKVKVGESISWTRPGGHRDVPINERGQMLLNPRFALRDYRTVTFDQVLEGKANLDSGLGERTVLHELEGKLVILYDPAFEESAHFAKVCQAVANILQEDYLVKTLPVATYGLPLFLILVASLFSSVFHRHGPYVVALVVLVAAWMISEWFFRQNLIWPWAATTLSLMMVVPWTYFYLRLVESMKVPGTETGEIHPPEKPGSGEQAPPPAGVEEKGGEKAGQNKPL